MIILWFKFAIAGGKTAEGGTTGAVFDIRVYNLVISQVTH